MLGRLCQWRVCFYRPVMSTIVQQAFTNEIRNIGLDHDSNSSRFQRISSSGASAIEKSWTLIIEDKNLVGQTFGWEAPITDTQLLWTSRKKGTIVTIIREPSETPSQYNRDLSGKRTWRHNKDTVWSGEKFTDPRTWTIYKCTGWYTSPSLEIWLHNKPSQTFIRSHLTSNKTA